ncbi:TetR/AcrR family transcriptional regulator [Mycobacteroides abscessus]|uniref:TetR/AcrR family transcriptional regulator n=1 Tax=Mycobacteroides abscessus TaxID=36809 RepID=UPI00092877E5|nr:TetR/AcrR family transcriptional regulator [Mycobacteroides abscessus]SHT62793.1 transcriptional regulator [Mycobacteroides abscessus subsp. bolletii]SHW18891.1 transcriptional regulator [Mycobacteroides abscessus subsp. bolletii]SHW52573.1 transcriptional regulator [Mycobacteroides abscessus subsp. bolletii]SHX14452.1 transcriptional regulator [Mycobacteroides abscessus subsp. bolletii]SKS06349.1 transcriptional regulator [Mycobacteroides abscessus subsp. bolletii]
MSAVTADTPATAPKRRRLQAPVRRELILDAALRTFAEKGHGASMVDVAAAAGITRSVVYHYFPSKKDLLLEVLRSEMGALITHLVPVMTSADVPQARLHRTLDGLLTFADESPSSWKVLFGAYGSQSIEPAVGEALAEGYDAAIAVGIQVLTAEVEATGLEPDSVRIRVLGEIFLATIVGVASWIHRHPEASKDDALTTMVDVLWRGLDGMLR